LIFISQFIRFINKACKEMTMKTIAALFDCDGTLYSAQFGRGLMKYASEHERKGTAQVYCASIFLPYVLRKLKLLREEKLLRPVIARLAWFLQGFSEEEGKAVFEWVTHEYLLPTQRADILARLREHQMQGHAVVLVSGAFQPALAQLAQTFGATGFVGTQVEIQDRYYTGRIVPPVNTGSDKDRRTREFFTSRGIEVDWNASYAYADSITDQGLLNLVGHPVAVYPDAKLHTFAQTQNWEMIGTPKS
jgi:HAD superfamily hydrolase (TIGR01490 family)